MSSNYSPSKRQRESEQARKREEKDQTRMARRGRAPGKAEIISASEMHGNLPSIDEALAKLQGGGGGNRSSATIPARLFVGGISDEVTETELRAVFAQFGPVSDAVIILNRDTQAPRGFGFVTMANRRDAPRAIEALEGSDLKGKSLVVHVATERQR